jgi:hypothetical protein
MVHPRLQVFLGPEHQRVAQDSRAGDPIPNQVSVTLGEVLPSLVDAFRTRRAWISDFEDDKITLSADLYEVLVAYQQLRPAA